MVAVKQLDKHGLHGNKEFQAEVLSLAKLEHPNLVKLIGYCADGDQRLLVFEYVSGGSLQDHLYGMFGFQNITLFVCLEADNRFDMQIKSQARSRWVG